MPLSRNLFRALVALVSTGTVAHTAVRSAPVQAASEADGTSRESAVFGRYSDLEAEETEARLKELSGSDETYETLRSLNKSLAAGAGAKDVEKTLLGLVEKATTDEVDATLAAILLDYYETYLRDGLVDGSLQPADVFDELDDRNDVLTSATYGSDWRSDRAIRRARMRR